MALLPPGPSTASWGEMEVEERYRVGDNVELVQDCDEFLEQFAFFFALILHQFVHILEKLPSNLHIFAHIQHKFAH